MEMYKKYRPKTLKGVLGQDGAIAALQRLIEKKAIPHAILFTGPSGVGKTTIARILKELLDCSDHDFMEVNSADFKGIDTIREIRRSVGFSPINGTAKVWLIDECHQMTKDAQNALLKLLEDTPGHVYFMLCTTDPQKLISTIHTRCTEVKLNKMSDKAVKLAIDRVINKEQWTVTQTVSDEIIEAADGSCRKALVILGQIGMLDGEDAQLEALKTTTINKDLAISLARVLVSPQAKWPEAAALLKAGKDEEPEGVRYLVLGYARTILLGGGKLSNRCFAIIEIFSKNFYDSKQAGLAAACWEVIHNAPK